MLPTSPKSTAVSNTPVLASPGSRAKRLAARPRALDAEACALSVRCDAPWGSHVASLELPAAAGVSAALARFHRRLSMELERVWERVELTAGESPLGLSSLLLAPEQFTQRARFIARHGIHSGAADASHEDRVTLRIEATPLEDVTEHVLAAALVSPLCAALLGSGARVSAEASIVGVLVAMLHEELSRHDSHLR